MSRKRLFVLSVGLAATLIATSLAPVLASYPGAENGRIAYGVRAADGSSNVFSALPDGTGVRQLTTGTGNHLCAAYSADGKQIAYCSDASGSWEIWSMKQNGTKHRQVTHLNGFSTFPDFSPNGSKIAFTSFLDAEGSDEIYVVNASNGLGLTQLTDCPGVGTFCINDFPAWSPNGRQIAFIHAEQFDGDGNPLDEQVWVMDANGGNQHAAHDRRPVQGPGPGLEPGRHEDRLRVRPERHLGDERQRHQPAPAHRLRTVRPDAVRHG